MNGDTIRGAAAAGRPSFGSWVAIGDGVAVEIMASAGFDWLILDAQHGGIDWHNLVGALQVAELGGVQPLVRVQWTDPAQIMRALDLGAAGVVVPMVSNAEQARIAAEATRYPPKGIRSFGKVRSYYGAGGDAPEPLCFVMIETAEAIDNLDEIASVPGVDGLFVGPVDLALSLGLGPALVMPSAVLDAIDRVVAVCRAHAIIAGCPSLGTDNARELVRRGVGFVTLGSDIGFLRRGAAEMVALSRELADCAPATNGVSPTR